MATNSEHPRRFDLRTTIPLATETLVSLARQPKRSWIIPALTLFTGVALAAVMLEMIFSPGSASALGFKGELRSRLLADYAEDPVVARIHELRLTIVEAVLGMDEGDGSGPSVIALLLKEPVPTATHKATAIQTSTPVLSLSPSASSEPTVVITASPLPGPSSTPPTPTLVAMGGSCDDLSITRMWVRPDDDQVRADVHNSGSKSAAIVHTVLEWPHVPDPAYVDYFKFGKKYHDDLEDHQSPTVSSKRSRPVKSGKTETWRADFDHFPDGGIYGSFTVTLTFEISGLGTCTLSASTFKDFPSSMPEPTDTPEPTPVPTGTPAATSTPMDTPTPVDTPTPESPTPEPPTPTPGG
ncbi:MAG: hypothetical protein O6949_05625 [Chloroflexi bacterium]|nr:hypothetical protein [Chloroflexota bacterium]